ncbi:type II toxin-antitoxin system death-on-curing family toxin [Laribacter hongkongensis]|uniref:type II toxin-antitoxin system death-on-curing family toxin n=1 Tax=Laribacter hongkongensis TaxID=168471 RepID=UPI001EFE75DE|nr:type II toxin-antitoxin system death-on-curing family toxin [Laribacter hongkongensis]MCG9059790.1 type II toxin-antitoxin system death-on-curing family toxin [Laribacter hongkongensis]MCG9084132.1 type II toxin-antitoxin system death-on-curing family toxin [Laribacter hongkongensis]MCG9086530.1 type II toxin-antitoxin system death-on-curing family toxin [Laribacter hongkongensis]
MIDVNLVIEIHDAILEDEPGLIGLPDIGKLEGALARIDNQREYAGIDDVFEIAALYAVALARGHCFNDANKRTALVTALTYLDLQGIEIRRSAKLEDIMVDVASGSLPPDRLADLLFTLSSI